MNGSDAEFAMTPPEMLRVHHIKACQYVHDRSIRCRAIVRCLQKQAWIELGALATSWKIHIGVFLRD